jgi:Topoisomerase 6 subunit A/Spo11, Toprim domain
MAEDFGWLNPHLSLKVIWQGKRCVAFKASDPAWAKWRPCDPTSPHWYDQVRLRRLMGAYIARDEDHGREPRTVRDFIAEFCGLSGSAKQKEILGEVGAARLSLPEYFGAGDRVNNDRIAKLLAAMKDRSRPIKPVDLGLIGRDHLAARFKAAGADLRTFRYRRIFGETDGVPDVIETAFGWCPSGAKERRIITGVNWSPAIGNPFRSLGPYGESLDSILTEQRSGRDEPIVFVLHLARPRIEFTDHGKTAIAILGNREDENADYGSGATMNDRTMAERLKDSVLFVTRDWAKQRKAEERHASALANRRARLVRASDYYNFKSAAFEVMELAYMAASANGTLPASARQVMYQARPFIQEKMGGQQLNDQYFCQQLLPDYMDEHGVDWDVTYDDRGHFTEPHTGYSIGLGTISVRDYLASIVAPKLEEPSFAAGNVDTRVLFIEKEGFVPLFEAVHFAERYDLAIMSSKGMSSTAARTLIDDLCKNEVPLLTLHDLDKAGFSIVGTLKRDTRRFTFGNQAKVIDLGLRLADVRKLGLEASAEDAFDRGRDAAKLENLRLNGATREEARFLLTQRVELNALTSGQLVAFIEGKLNEHGIKKLIPNADLLRDAYRLFVNSKRVEKVVADTIKDIETEKIATPGNLSARVAAHLRQHPKLRWDAAVAAIAEDGE